MSPLMMMLAGGFALVLVAFAGQGLVRLAMGPTASAAVGRALDGAAGMVLKLLVLAGCVGALWFLWQIVAGS